MSWGWGSFPFLQIQGVKISSSEFIRAARLSEVSKRVGGRGLPTSKRPKQAKTDLQKCVPLLLRGHRPQFSGIGSISSRQPPLSANPFSKLLSLQNEIAPENFLNGYEKWVLKTRKRIRNVHAQIKAPLTQLKNSHRRFSKSFTPPKIRTKKMIFFSQRGSAG